MKGLNILESRILAEKIARLIYEKKGSDILILDIKESSIICDYFVIATGTSRIHNKAISNYVDMELKNEIGPENRRIQGRKEGGWLLLDYGTVIVHIFLDSLRKYYDLEELWKTGKIINLDLNSMESEEKVV